MIVNVYELLRAKVRNFIYYYNIDTRPHTQYLHVMKDIRQMANDLLEEADRVALTYGTRVSNPEQERYLRGILKIIPKDVKNSMAKEIKDKLVNLAVLDEDVN